MKSSGGTCGAGIYCIEQPGWAGENMPLDKIALCSLTPVTPPPCAYTLHRAGHGGIRVIAPDKDRIILSRQLKQKDSQR
jgi:hypothetical protein